MEDSKNKTKRRYLVTMTVAWTGKAETELEAENKAKVYFLKVTQEVKDPLQKAQIQTEEILEQE